MLAIKRVKNGLSRQETIVKGINGSGDGMIVPQYNVVDDVEPTGLMTTLKKLFWGSRLGAAERCCIGKRRSGPIAVKHLVGRLGGQAFIYDGALW